MCQEVMRTRKSFEYIQGEMPRLYVVYCIDEFICMNIIDTYAMYICMCVHHERVALVLGKKLFVFSLAPCHSCQHRLSSGVHGSIVR